jgi:hypothetical protein
MSILTSKLQKRRGITFTSADPIQATILELEKIYENSLDLPSIIKVALIEHKQKKLKEMGLFVSPLYREANEEEAESIDTATLEDTISYEEAQKALKKLGVNI